MEFSVALLAQELERAGRDVATAGELETHLTLTGMHIFLGEAAGTGAPGELVLIDQSRIDGLRSVALPESCALAIACPPEQDLALAAESASSAEAPEVLAVACKGGVAELANAILGVRKRLDAWDNRLLCAMADKSPLQKILDIAEIGLDNPFALCNRSSKLIAYAGTLPDGYQQTIWAGVLKQRCLPLLSYFTPKERDAWSRGIHDESGEPVIVVSTRPRGVRHMALTIRHKGEVIGTISLVDFTRTLGPAQLGVAMHIRDRLQQALVALLTTQDLEDPLVNSLRLLLSGDEMESLVLQHHMNDRGWSVSDQFCMVVMPLPKETDQKDGGAYAEQMRISHRDAIVIAFEGFLVMAKHLGESSRDGLLALRNQLEDEHSLEVPCGISDEFELPDARAAYRQALIALSEAKRSSKGIALFSDTFRSYILALVEQAQPLGVTCHPAALRCARRDDARDALACLSSFILHGENVTQTARALFVNRNTFEYRIKTLQADLGLDMAHMSEEEQFRLLFSCQMLLEKGEQ